MKASITMVELFKRIHTLRSNKISSLPIAILMPHSGCNCRCIMCDIWKGNKFKIELTESDILPISQTLRKLNTQEVVMSGGEAILNSNFFKLCKILKGNNVKITLLSTGIGLERYIPEIIRWVDSLIVSLDGDASIHNKIRAVPNAFSKLETSIHAIKSKYPSYPISARTVIHRENYKIWKDIIYTAQKLSLDSISFLPADISSQAFNRLETWDIKRQNEVLVPLEELPQLEEVMKEIMAMQDQIQWKGFIVENAKKLWDIFRYYSAIHGLGTFPYKKCNAPWVSTVIEADGTVRPCFFLESLGNIRSNSLLEILNSEKAVQFRKDLDPEMNETCKRCVCSLNLSPLKNIN